MCEIILNLDQWFRRRCILKIFIIWSSGDHFVQPSGTICAILVEGIMRKNPVKLFWIWTSGSMRCRLKIFIIWSSGSPFVQRSRNICAILVEGIMRNNSKKLFWIWASGSGDVVKKISHLELWRPSCSVEGNHLCNFDRGHHGEHSCEVIWNLEMSFKEKVNRWTTDGRRPITIAHLESSAQVS